MKRIFTLTIAMAFCATLSAQNGLCGSVRNTSFKAGEMISYTVFYSVAGLYVNAGTATFNLTLEQLNNKPVYHAVGTGTSNSKYDWIFKVRDRYESYFDTATLEPYKFIRNIDEGGYKKHQNVSFNQQTNTAVSDDGVYKVPDCIQDVISAVYYMRNIDFSKYKSGDKIPFDMFLDNEVYHLFIRYKGPETLKTKYGKFKTYKFTPLLVKGTLFEGGEKMTVWVSADQNRIPVRVESPIIVGSVKIDMMQYRNIRYPFSAMLSFK